MAITQGSVWVEGDYLYFVSSSGTTKRYLGSSIALRSGAVPGSVWIDDSGFLKYIDASNYEREYPYYSISTPSGINSAVIGSVWMESQRIFAASNYTGSSQIYKIDYHNDYGHTDNGSYSDHEDAGGAHADSGAHGDTYTNHNDYSTVPGFHVDSYLNTGSHTDFTDSTHADIDPVFSDSHVDSPEFVHTDFAV